MRPSFSIRVTRIQIKIALTRALFLLLLLQKPRHLCQDGFLELGSLSHQLVHTFTLMYVDVGESLTAPLFRMGFASCLGVTSFRHQFCGCWMNPHILRTVCSSRRLESGMDPVGKFGDPCVRRNPLPDIPRLSRTYAAPAG